MSYLLITSREKFIFEPMSVIDIETTVTEFLRSESKRFDTRYAGEADGSINKYEIPLRFCLYMQSVVTSEGYEFRHWPSHNRFIGVTPCRLKMYLSDSFGRLHTRYRC